jgi:arylsulfatase
MIVAVAAESSVVSATAAEVRRPNVIFILADDMGFSDAACYGGEISTPNLDSLAQRGVRFTQFYNTARCWPSRGVLLTGHYAQAIRRDSIPGISSGSQGQRPAWAPLLPELLRQLGYRSYHSGKWHVDGRPLEGGFDRAYTCDDHNRYFNPQQHSEDDKQLPPVQSGSGYYVTTAIADHAIKCLQEHSSSHGTKPFFQYIAFTSPHFPLQALQQDINRYRYRYRVGWNVVQADRGRRLIELGIAKHEPPPMEQGVGPPYDFTKELGPLGAGEVLRPLPWSDLTEVQRDFQATKMAIHAAMVERMDREIGRVIDQLKAMRAFENSLILFASDNGASAEIMIRGDGHDAHARLGSAATFLCLGPGWSSTSNTPFRRHKTWVHEGGIATPFIAHWPRGIAARGELRHQPAHLIDIVPTVLELAGGSHPKVWKDSPVPVPPGISLMPAFSRDGPVTHRELWWYHEGHRAVRVGDWKLVSAGPLGNWELYDLATDRGESNDLAGQHPETVRDLAARWTQTLDQFRSLAAEQSGERGDR